MNIKSFALFLKLLKLTFNQGFLGAYFNWFSFKLLYLEHIIIALPRFFPYLCQYLLNLFDFNLLCSLILLVSCSFWYLSKHLLKICEFSFYDLFSVNLNLSLSDLILQFIYILWISSYHLNSPACLFIFFSIITLSIWDLPKSLQIFRSYEAFLIDVHEIRRIIHIWIY